MQDMQSPSGEAVREVFAKFTTKDELVAAMDKRRTELESHGYKFVGRRKIGRNERCVCGSGKKFKKCCLPGMEGATIMRVEKAATADPVQP